MPDQNDVAKHTVINEILPKAGLVYSEKGNLSEVLCKPKIMPLKSEMLKKMEALEKGHEAGTAAAEAAVKDGGSMGNMGGGAGAGGKASQKGSEVMSFD